MSRSARVAALDRAIAAIEGDVVLAAHSAGCLMVAHWGAIASAKVIGALLATPADVERPLPEGYPTMADLDANGWLPIPRAKLPFPALVVASRNDPLAEFVVGVIAVFADHEHRIPIGVVVERQAGLLASRLHRGRDARVRHLLAQQTRQLAANLLAQPVGPPRHKISTS